MTNPIRTLGSVLRTWLDAVKVPSGRRKVEEQWRLSEERLRLATEAGRLGLWDWDLVSDRITFTGDLYERHGVRIGEPGRSASELIALTHPDDREMLRKGMAEAMRHSERYEAEFRAVWPDDVVSWLFVTGRILRQDGRVVRITGAVVDIDERKRVELALRETEERFAKAFGASPMGLVLYCLSNGKLIEVNQTFCDVTGWTRDEVVGRTTAELDLFPAADGRRLHVRTVHEAGSVRNLVFRFFTRRGEERVGLLSSEHIVIGGEPHVLAVIQDITEREKVQAALRESEARLRLVLRAASAGVWEIDLRTGETFWSDEFRDLYGYEKSRPADQSDWGERLHPEDAEPVTADFRNSLETDVREFHREFRIVHPTRAVRWIHTAGNIDRDAAGNPTKLRGISLDISRIKEAEQELRDADRRKNEFLAMLAHELRNPLAPMRNGLAILKMAPNSEIAERARAMMERQLQQMVRLIDELLEVSRISQGKIQLDRRLIELGPVLQDAIEMSKPLIEAAGHTLSVDVPQRSLIVNADGVRLAQVFGNLLNNAAKFTNPGGHIWLSVEAAEDEVNVTVRDNGIGIEPEMLPHIFELFAQADQGTQHGQGGLGIGLNIARRLIEKHGGTVEARSKGRGTGSEFTVRLPLHASAQASATEDTSKPVEPPTHPLRVLVADDNADAAMSLALILRIGGHEVLAAYDGEQALRIAESFQPDLAFLDIGMPVMDGYEVCRRLRALPGGQDMLIIALTGWGQAEDKERSRQAGFDHHLVKPAELPVLERLLAEAEQSRRPIGRRRSNQSN